MSDDERKIEVLYDDQCPVCHNYCTRVEMKDAKDKLVLVDARKDGALLDEVTKQGLDIDQGMVVKVDGKLFYGAEAMREIVKLKKAGAMERFLFNGPKLAAAVYGGCKGVRNVLLKLLGIKKIENLKK